jgi:hypothetical protein
MEIGAGDLLGAWDLKTACNGALFSCPEGYWVGDDTDELADVVSVGDCEMALLEVGGLI